MKIDGTGRLTLQNRRFFRKYTLPNSILDYQSGQAISLANKPQLQTTHLTDTFIDNAFQTTIKLPACQVPPPNSLSSVPDSSFSPSSGNDMAPSTEMELQNLCNPTSLGNTELPPEAPHIVQPIDLPVLPSHAQNVESNDSSQVIATGHPKRARSTPKR